MSSPRLSTAVVVYDFYTALPPLIYPLFATLSPIHHMGRLRLSCANLEKRRSRAKEIDRNQRVAKFGQNSTAA